MTLIKISCYKTIDQMCSKVHYSCYLKYKAFALSKEVSQSNSMKKIISWFKFHSINRFVNYISRQHQELYDDSIQFQYNMCGLNSFNIPTIIWLVYLDWTLWYSATCFYSKLTISILFQNPFVRYIHKKIYFHFYQG